MMAFTDHACCTKGQKGAYSYCGSQWVKRSILQNTNWPTHIFCPLPFSLYLLVVLVLVFPDCRWLEVESSEGIVVSVWFKLLHLEQQPPPSLHQLDQALQA